MVLTIRTQAPFGLHTVRLYRIAHFTNSEMRLRDTRMMEGMSLMGTRSCFHCPYRSASSPSIACDHCTTTGKHSLHTSLTCDSFEAST